MYKCTECGTEFDTKPQYCDCGNDTFEEINPAAVVPPEPEIVKPKRPVSELKIKKEKVKIERKPADILSWAIFATCLMLSLIIIFFIGNPKERLAEEVQKEQNVAQNIPSIEKFWNNSTEGVKSDIVEVQEPVKVQPVQQIVQKVIPQTSKPAAQTQKQTAKTTQTVQSKKPIQKTTTQTKPTTTQTNTTNQTPKIPQNTLNVASNQQPVKVTTNTQNSTKPVAQTTSQAQTNQVNPAVQKQELKNYKVSLRNTIGRKIDFTKVVGDGECTISFKVSSSGQLTNRTFTKQSTNVTLNDAVYQAMMSTPSFTRPPELYKNETLNLNVSFKNGNFAISLQ